MCEFVDETEHQLLEPMQTAQIGQTNMWDAMRYGTQESPFARDPQVEAHRRMIARHKLWLDSITHEYPSPYEHYRIGIYIRYFNQTKYPNYLDYHKQEYNFHKEHDNTTTGSTCHS